MTSCHLNLSARREPCDRLCSRLSPPGGPTTTPAKQPVTGGPQAQGRRTPRKVMPQKADRIFRAERLRPKPVGDLMIRPFPGLVTSTRLADDRTSSDIERDSRRSL